MEVRQPVFDFAGIDPVWASDVPLVHWVNAYGLIPAYIEPFMIKVMQRARPLLDPVADAELLRDSGYPEMSDHEQALARQYEELLETKPLDWLLGYCEGFESMGLVVANAWVDGALQASLPDADPRPIALWRWHLAEEYEHRTVVFRVLRALYGERPSRFYRLRLLGLLHVMRHLGRAVVGLHTYLVESHADAAGRSLDRRARRLPSSGAFGLPALAIVKVLAPRYDPMDVPPPTRLAEALALR
ncbi:MAG TPA: metal-dependent hydrolase [Mycobacteriales bacterium]|nr:metal-dependent hydrolase [Mycobacteriales bacterium]